ncbi:MAG: hypothetical protein OSA98_17185 [Rubripirellula sp.]|nr:hypothetical protein [Rubripirellula sp.]
MSSFKGVAVSKRIDRYFTSAMSSLDRSGLQQGARPNGCEQGSVSDQASRARHLCAQEAFAGFIVAEEDHRCGDFRVLAVIQ